MGFVQVYTGSGRGKTSAAFGLALRALGAGLSVYIGQFVKGMQYHETILADLFDQDHLLIEQLGRGCFIDKDPDEADVRAAESALRRARKLMEDGRYRLVILDELTIAHYYHLLTTEEIIDALDARADDVEIIITGRYAPQELLDYADLVTDMQEVKHYYTLYGTLSRPGFDH